MGEEWGGEVLFFHFLGASVMAFLCVSCYFPLLAPVLLPFFIFIVWTCFCVFPFGLTRFFY